MEQYTDDERVEDMKKWWKENGASIIVGIVLGVIAIFGWRYWNSYRDTQAETASRAYDAFIVAVQKPDAADSARQLGQAVIADFPKSPYATLAALHLAKLAGAGGDHAAASQQLEWVIGNARLDEFKDIARLRLARVKVATGQAAEAEKLLDGISTASLSAEREELKGDLYLAGKNPEKARTAYAAALAASGDNRILQFKLDELATATPDTVVPAPVAPPTPPAPPPVEPAKSSSPPAPAANATAPAATAAPPAALTEPQAATSSPAAPADSQPTAPAEPTPAPPPPSSSSGQ